MSTLEPGRTVRKCSRFFERHLLRHRKDLTDRDDQRIGVSTEFGHAEDAVPDLVLGDAFAKPVNRAGHFVADDAWDLGRVGVEPDAGHQIGEVDAGRSHADANLALAGLGVRRASHLEDFGRASAGDPYLSHVGIIARWAERPAQTAK
jgi:hypothetical protein